MNFDVIIIGAGASGLMCAITAGERGRNVLLLEGARNIGNKILISGGGNCNFTNLHVSPEHYFSQNPKFCISALSRFTPQDFIKLLGKHRISYNEKKSGRLFCNHGSEKIVKMFINECKANGVTIKTNSLVINIDKKEKFIVTTKSDKFVTDSLVIATGGLSYPKLGTTGFGYSIAEQFGLAIITRYPALVPLTFTGSDRKRYQGLSGVSVSAKVSIDKISFEENILFTHKGLSGPAILQISGYWTKGKTITINLLPYLNLEDEINKWKMSSPKSEIKTIMSKHLPRNLVTFFLENSIKDKLINQISKQDLKTLSEVFQKWQFKPEETEGYNKAEVTGGGIDTRELSPKTFESRKVSGLYFIGEVLDVTGWLGGYNLQWMWSSGYCAGMFV